MRALRASKRAALEPFRPGCNVSGDHPRLTLRTAGTVDRQQLWIGFHRPHNAGDDGDRSGLVCSLLNQRHGVMHGCRRGHLVLFSRLCEFQMLHRRQCEVLSLLGIVRSERHPGQNHGLLAMITRTRHAHFPTGRIANNSARPFLFRYHRRNFSVRLELPSGGFQMPAVAAAGSKFREIRVDQALGRAARRRRCALIH